MLSQEKIVELMNDARTADLLGTAHEDLALALDPEHVEPFLKEGVEEWSQFYKTDEDVLAAMRKYMDFAWEKANNFRGISASRTMRHYWAWLTLIGQDELAAETLEYEFYGKPQLVKICEFLGLNSDLWDDGVRANSEF